MAVHRQSGMAAFFGMLACSTLFLASSATTSANTATTQVIGVEALRPTLSYTHTWPEMKLGWKIVVGTIMAFCGAAFGSVGGGAAGTFIPMLTIIIGFDTKSAISMSKCMITGVAASTLYFNIRRRHPTLDMPVIDYDLALLFQPMLVLGISIGVTLNVILPTWTVTLLFVVLCLVTSIIAYCKGTTKWKQETIQKEFDKNETADELFDQNLIHEPEKQSKVSIIQNVQWKKLSVIVSVWIAILVLQIIKSHTTDYSGIYWAIDLLQIPVAVAASGYEAVMLYQGKSVIASRGEDGTHFRVCQLLYYCIVGVVAGTLGGIVGLGGGVLLGPVFLEMGVPPQVIHALMIFNTFLINFVFLFLLASGFPVLRTSRWVTSATTIFAVLFSASMSAVEYYLLHRFPLPYTLYFVAISVVAAFTGQHVVKWVVAKLGRESPIIFIIAFTLFISAVFIGGEGVVDMIEKIVSKSKLGWRST